MTGSRFVFPRRPADCVRRNLTQDFGQMGIGHACFSAPWDDNRKVSDPLLSIEHLPSRDCRNARVAQSPLAGGIWRASPRLSSSVSVSCRTSVRSTID